MTVSTAPQVLASQAYEAFSTEDREAINRRGIERVDVLNQISHLIEPRSVIVLNRPAILGDGIQALPDFEDCPRFAEAARLGRLSAFVPASGDATRMFESLYKMNQASEVSEDALMRKAAGGDADAAEVLKVLRNIDQFALWVDLERAGCNKRDWRGILTTMLSTDRMAVGQTPKGLLPFHVYGNFWRTAVEEHCHSAQGLGFGSIHFTIKASAVEEFEKAVARIPPPPERVAPLRVTYSFQKKATDTICLASDGGLYKDHEGIVFRAGGHGSLLTNLMETLGDIVFIRNIDNIVIEDKFQTINSVRKKMAERLLEVEAKVHCALHNLVEGGSTSEAAEVLTNDFGLTVQPDGPVEYYFEQLNRPIRICGVIRTKGDIGGGIYWTSEPEAVSRLQIVEGAQLTYSDEMQQAIARQLAYFNPVDIVCSIRDFRGVAFNLHEFSDNDAVIVTRKSKNGQTITAFERPGLWNGGMSRWNSLFVEIPSETFQPVKRFSDLMSPFHRSH